MEASAIRVRVGAHRHRVTIAAPLLRLRSDQQLVAQFRAGNEDAFSVIHDRYRARLLAYVRRMLPGTDSDAEDTLQDVFVRAYAGLRAGHGELSLRPWLYRVAHNRCVDVVRRPQPAAIEPLELEQAGSPDPAVESERRESLRRLVTDIGRLPEQQRSALLMRELGGVAYADIAAALGVSVPAVKSLLVRARMGLAAALEARDTACTEIRRELADAHERGVRASGIARRHMRDCRGCQEYRTELRSISRQFAALAPTLGPLGVLTKILGAGGGGGAAASGGAAAAGGAVGTGGTVLGLATSHIAALVAAAVVTAGGAVELQQTVSQLGSSPTHHRHHVASAPPRDPDQMGVAQHGPALQAHPATVSTTPDTDNAAQPPAAPVASATTPTQSVASPSTGSGSQSIGPTHSGGTSTAAAASRSGATSAAGTSSATPSCQTPVAGQTGSASTTNSSTSSSTPGSTGGSTAGSSTDSPSGSTTGSTTSSTSGSSVSCTPIANTLGGGVSEAPLTGLNGSALPGKGMPNGTGDAAAQGSEASNSNGSD